MKARNENFGFLFITCIAPLIMDDFFKIDASLIEPIDLSLFGIPDGRLDIIREDLLHPHISGNKFRKLKYNLINAKDSGQNTLLTFGGAYSNHILAVAAAGKEFGFKTIGVIRGNELENKPLNPTLTSCREFGMNLYFISREDYRKKENPDFIEKLKQNFGDFYLLPEGGTNELAVRGCSEILTEKDAVYDCVCVAVGTGGTLAGISESIQPHQKVIGFSVLKGTFQKTEIQKYSSQSNFEITDSYSFGGYGKIDSKLIRFINEFKEKTGIPLDPVYTGKLFYGILDLYKNIYFKKNNRILAVHSGGLQGIAGMNERLNREKLPLIH